MNEQPSLQHLSPSLPIEGRWIPVTFPPSSSSSDMIPDLAQSVLIDVLPEPGASPFDSVANVAAAVAKSGGAVRHGWNLTQFHSSRENANLIEASAHAVWVTPQGVLVDVTPSSSYNRMQSCFIPSEREWKTLPNGIFFVPAKASQVTISELRQILEAKHHARKYLQKKGLAAGHHAAIDMQDLQSYCRSHIISPKFDIVFQFVRLELVRLKVMG